jgi:hypothetical protein
MSSDCAHRHRERFCDLVVGQAVGDEGRDLAFTADQGQRRGRPQPGVVAPQSVTIRLAQPLAVNAAPRRFCRPKASDACAAASAAAIRSPSLHPSQH